MLTDSCPGGFQLEPPPQPGSFPSHTTPLPSSLTPRAVCPWEVTVPLCASLCSLNRYTGLTTVAVSQGLSWGLQAGTCLEQCLAQTGCAIQLGGCYCSSVCVSWGRRAQRTRGSFAQGIQS